MATEIDEIADWLCAMGYGFDFCNPESPCPEILRRPLAEAYLRESVKLYGDPGDETVDDHLEALWLEGAFGRNTPNPV